MSRSLAMPMMLAAMMLAACDRNKPVGGVSPEDAAALNNAAEMLDASPDGLAAPEGLQPGNDAESGSANENDAAAAQP